MKLGFGIHWQLLGSSLTVGEKFFASSELEKRPKCQEQLEFFKAKPLQAHAAIAVIKVVLMTVLMSLGSGDVTRK